MNAWYDDLLKLLLAVVLGGLIGFEREVHDKPAGFRTMILIAVGSTLFTIFSIRVAGPLWDPGRIAAQIVTGVGFLGAGAIMRERRKVIGLTTAAAIWLVASLGIGAGLGQFKTTLAASFLVVVILLTFARIERWLDIWRDEHTYSIGLNPPMEEGDRLRRTAEDLGLRLQKVRFGRVRETMHLSFSATGSRDAHRELTRRLLRDETVIEMTQD